MRVARKQRRCTTGTETLTRTHGGRCHIPAPTDTATQDISKSSGGHRRGFLVCSLASNRRVTLVLFGAVWVVMIVEYFLYLNNSGDPFLCFDALFLFPYLPLPISPIHASVEDCSQGMHLNWCLFLARALDRAGSPTTNYNKGALRCVFDNTTTRVTNRPATTAYLPIISLKNFSRRQSICAMYSYRSGAINGFKTVATAGRAHCGMMMMLRCCGVHRSIGWLVVVVRIIKRPSAVELSVP